MTSSKRPDILLIGREWRSRALARAQLLEDGFDVIAVESWREAGPILRSKSRPLVVVFDLAGEPRPAAILKTLRRLISGDRVLVLTAAGALRSDEIRQLGFQEVLARPFSVGEAASATAKLVTRARDFVRTRTLER